MIDADLSMLLLLACASRTPHVVALWCDHLMVTRDNVNIDFSMGNYLALSVMRVAAGLNPRDILSYISFAMTSMLIPRKLITSIRASSGFFPYYSKLEAQLLLSPYIGFQ